LWHQPWICYCEYGHKESSFVSLRNKTITGNKWATDNISLRSFSPNWLSMSLSKSVVFSILFHLSHSVWLYEHIEIIDWTLLSSILSSILFLPCHARYFQFFALRYFDSQYRKSSFSSSSPTIFISLFFHNYSIHSYTLHCFFFYIKNLKRYRYYRPAIAIFLTS